MFSSNPYLSPPTPTLHSPKGSSNSINLRKGTFVQKLFSILSNETFKTLIYWSDSGNSFFISDVEEFESKVLPLYYRHNNFTSFVRSLNMYDFQKVSKGLRGPPGLKQSASTKQELWEFSNVHFRRDANFQQFEKIKRKLSIFERSCSITPKAPPAFSKSFSQQDNQSCHLTVNTNLATVSKLIPPSPKYSPQHSIYSSPQYTAFSPSQHEILCNSPSFHAFSSPSQKALSPYLKFTILPSPQQLNSPASKSVYCQSPLSKTPINPTFGLENSTTAFLGTDVEDEEDNELDLFFINLQMENLQEKLKNLEGTVKQVKIDLKAEKLKATSSSNIMRNILNIMQIKFQSQPANDVKNTQATSSLTLPLTSASFASVASTPAKVPIALHGIDGRYATALYSAAQRQNSLTQVHQDLKSLQQKINADKQLKFVLETPIFGRDIKLKELKALLSKGSYNKLTGNFFNVLAENGRLDQVEKINHNFDLLISASKGEVTIIVTSAQVDPAIVGGLIIEIGEKTIDLSVSAKVNKLNRLLSEAI
ncbi:ATP synthase subunit O, mitochondrial [Clydaea vesicula]|uniref:ATP synthase subunit 5, mitochondrial n=1 Tax=Clydaea vesicula TaxID=447962 RepID=A0AAD5U8H7_9FUNG|nr:ATP synthase subunit O, mitochondrial [Clydaea vesicula]